MERSFIDQALARLRAMATRPLPPIPMHNREAAEQIRLAAQYQADLSVVLAELDRLRKKGEHW